MMIYSIIRAIIRQAAQLSATSLSRSATAVTPPDVRGLSEKLRFRIYAPKREARLAPVDEIDSECEEEHGRRRPVTHCYHITNLPAVDNVT